MTTKVSVTILTLSIVFISVSAHSRQISLNDSVHVSQADNSKLAPANKTCQDIFHTSAEILSFKTNNEYLVNGGIHNALEKITAAINSQLEQKRSVSDPITPAAALTNVSFDHKEKDTIFATLLTLVNESMRVGCDHTIDSTLPQFSHSQKSRLQKAKQWLKSESIDSKSVSVINADTLLALSMSSESGLHFIIMNINPFSKQTLPLSFFNAGNFANSLTQEQIDRTNNPVLQPADFMLLTFLPNTQPK